MWGGWRGDYTWVCLQMRVPTCTHIHADEHTRTPYAHTDLILLVAHDSHGLAGEARDNVLGDGVVSLVRPEDLAIMGCNLRRPHIKVLVALEGAG